MIKLSTKRIKALKPAEQSLWGHPVSDISGHEFSNVERIFITPDDKVVTEDEAALDLSAKFEKVTDEDRARQILDWCRKNYLTKFNPMIQLPAFTAILNGKEVFAVDCIDWPELTFAEYADKFGYKEVDAEDLFDKFDSKTSIGDAKIVNYKYYSGDRYTPSETSFEVISDFSGDNLEPYDLWENPEGKIGTEEEIFEDFKNNYAKKVKDEDRREALDVLGEADDSDFDIFVLEFTGTGGEHVKEYGYDIQDLFDEFATEIGYKEINADELLEDYLANKALEGRG